MEAPAVPGLRTICTMGGGSVARLWASAPPASAAASTIILIYFQTRSAWPALIGSTVMRLAAHAVSVLACTILHAPTPVHLRVDATDAPRRLFHLQMSLPAKPGPMTLLYPEWIPGEHGPTRPIANFVGLRI